MFIPYANTAWVSMHYGKLCLDETFYKIFAFYPYPHLLQVCSSSYPVSRMEMSSISSHLGRALSFLEFNLFACLWIFSTVVDFGSIHNQDNIGYLEFFCLLAWENIFCTFLPRDWKQTYSKQKCESCNSPPVDCSQWQWREANRTWWQCILRIIFFT